MTIIRSLAALGVAIALAAALSACRTSKEETYDFDPAAHQRAVELKSKALALMTVSGEAYSRHRADVEAVSGEMDEAFALSAAAPDNAVVAAEWSAMKDPAGALFGGFVRAWQASGSVGQAARDEAIVRVTLRFDYILCLEAAKRTKGGLCTPPGGEAADAPPAEAPPA